MKTHSFSHLWKCPFIVYDRFGYVVKFQQSTPKKADKGKALKKKPQRGLFHVVIIFQTEQMSFWKGGECAEGVVSGDVDAWGETGSHSPWQFSSHHLCQHVASR